MWAGLALRRGGGRRRGFDAVGPGQVVTIAGRSGPTDRFLAGTRGLPGGPRSQAIVQAERARNVKEATDLLAQSLKGNAPMLIDVDMDRAYKPV